MSQRRTSFVAKSCRKILLDYLFFNFVVDKVDGKYALFKMGGGGNEVAKMEPKIAKTESKIAKNEKVPK